MRNKRDELTKVSTRYLLVSKCLGSRIKKVATSDPPSARVPPTFWRTRLRTRKKQAKL